MPKQWPPRFCASFVQLCRERCAGAWNVREWWVPIVQAFTIQTVIHFICYAIYLLQLNKKLPFTRPSLGMPYSISVDQWAALGIWALPPMIVGVCIILVKAPVFEELRYRGTVWLGLVVFRQRWAHWIIIGCGATIWAFLHGRAVLGTAELVAAGFFSGWLVLKTKNIVPSMLFHSAWNAGVLLCAIYGLK